MKTVVITVRVLMGLLFVVSSLGYFFNLMPAGELSAGAQAFFSGMVASKYLLPFIKTVELLCGIAFISGRFVPLATVVIFPITINIVLFHVFLAPEGMIVPALLLIGNLFLAFTNRSKYETLIAI